MAIKKKKKKKALKAPSVSSAAPPDEEESGRQLDTTATSSGRSGNSDDEEPDKEEESDEDFIALAMERWQASADHESETRALMIDDFKFSTLDQWPINIKSQRDADGRPCLTMDQLGQAIKQVTNEQRQQRPAIQVDPRGSGASRDVAEVFQGMTRHIEINSDAEVAYDTSFDHMVRGGRGWIRILTEYEPGTFDQEIIIERVKNPFTVYDDPASEKFDGSDARFRFVVSDMARSEYKTQYPKSDMASLTGFSSLGDTQSQWASKDSIRVAEYFYVIETPRKIVKMADGSVKNFDALPKDGSEDGQIVKTRTEIDRQVMWAKINAIETLEKKKWDGDVIPLIPVIGDDVEVDGKRYLAGLVRAAKDPQRMYNYHCSSATEAVALAPKAPFIGAVGQFASQEDKWKQANTRNFAYLEYDNVDVDGKPAGAPQRNSVEPPIQALMLMIRQANNDIKASIGIYDASLGQPGPEQSGKAILARQKQGDVATLNYADNLSRAIRAVGRAVVYLIPKIYDIPRIQRIVEADGTVKQVGIYNSQNGGFSPAEAQEQIQKMEGGDVIKKVFDIGVGKYDVTVSVGPSYQSKRAEAVTSMMQLISSYPQLMAIAGDLLVGNMDWPYADEISKRLKKSLPPNLQDSDDDTPEGQIAKLSAQVTNFQQQNQFLTQALNESSELIKTKRLELESKERIVLFQSQAAIVQAELKAHAEGAMLTMQKTMEMIQSRLDAIHNNVGIDVEDGEDEAGAAAGAGGKGDGGGGAGPAAAPTPSAPPGAPSVSDVVQSAQ